MTSKRASSDAPDRQAADASPTATAVQGVIRALGPREDAAVVRAMEALLRFSGRVSHDMNNFLAHVTLVAETLAESCVGESAEDAEDLRKFVGIGRTMSGRLGSISGNPQLVRKRRDLDEYVESLREVIEQGAGDAIRCSLLLHGRGAVVDIDADLVEQALLMLVDNAREAMTGPGELVIETGAAPSGALQDSCYTWIAVRDTGSGIAVDALDKIFEPFFTTKKGVRGAGLGLTKVWKVIRSHGGALEVHAAPGAGTTVFLGFPVPSSDGPARC